MKKARGGELGRASVEVSQCRPAEGFDQYSFLGSCIERTRL
jgi:hypothetical protein